MGYLHIENLYKAADILGCFALEKIHGTSAHVSYKKGVLSFYAGGCAHASFVKLFDVPALEAACAAKFTAEDEAVVYGEAFGGSMQGMSETYGKELRFLAFDVHFNDCWLTVPAAKGFAGELGIDFVPYRGGPLTLEWLDGQRDLDSEVAVVPGKRREGIVIRPIRELTHKDGRRWIYKHKIAQFGETKTPRVVDAATLTVLADADAVAEEWVTPMRLEHVLQKTPFESDADTIKVIRAMQEDVKREGEGEIVWSKAVEKAIGKATAALLHTAKMPTVG